MCFGSAGRLIVWFQPTERECRVSGSEREHVGELDLYPAVEIDVLAVLQVQHYQPDQNIRIMRMISMIMIDIIDNNYNNNNNINNNNIKIKN